MPNPVAEVVERLRSIGGPTREEAADQLADLLERQKAEIERLSRERDTGVPTAAANPAACAAAPAVPASGTGVPEGCRLTLENVTQLESILAAASHQQWEWTTFTKPDGSPIVSVEDVAETTAASARHGAGVELHGITPAGLAPDAEGPNVICYTGNGDGSAANARAIVSLWMAAPDLLKIARAMLSAAPQPPTVSPDIVALTRERDQAREALAELQTDLSGVVDNHLDKTEGWIGRELRAKDLPTWWHKVNDVLEKSRARSVLHPEKEEKA